MGPRPTGRSDRYRYAPYDSSSSSKNTGPRYPPSLFGEPKALPGGWRGSNTSAQSYNAAGIEHGLGYGYGQVPANSQRNFEPTDPTRNGLPNGENGHGGGSGDPSDGGAESQGSVRRSATGNSFNVTNRDPPDDPPSPGSPGGPMFDGNNRNRRHRTTETSTAQKETRPTAPISSEVSVRAREGNDQKIIALLDTGSSESWITKDCLEILGATEEVRKCVDSPVPRFEDRQTMEIFEAESEIELSVQIVLPNNDTVVLKKTRFFVFQTQRDYHMLFGSKLIISLDPAKLGAACSIITSLEELVSDPERGELRRAKRIRSEAESAAVRHRRWAVDALDRCAKYEYLEKTNGHFRKPDGIWVVDTHYGGWKWVRR